MTAKKTTTLSGALLQAQQAMSGGIAKDSTNDHHRYSYVSAEKMIGECRQALHDAGIVLTAGDVLTRDFVTADGNGLIVEVGYRLQVAGSSEETITLSRAWPAVPGRGRPIDKAVASAQTACLSYMLRDLLLIPRGDEAGVGMDDTARDAGTNGHKQVHRVPTPQTGASMPPRASVASQGPFTGEAEPKCPACGSRVWNNCEQRRTQQAAFNAGTRSSKPGPAWKCANKQCIGGRNGTEPWVGWEADEFPAPPPPPHVVDDVDERGEPFNADQDIPF